MANRAKGEATLKAGDKEYTLVFNMNARAALEDALDLNISQLVDLMKPEKLRHKHIITIVWAGLRKYHKELTKEDVGDLIDEAGLEETMKAFEKAFSASVEGLAENPPKPEPMKEAKAT